MKLVESHKDAVATLRTDPKTRSDAETGISNLKKRVAEVASIAASTAADVDSSSRFPAEAIAAAKTQRLLGILAPKEFGGEGASISDVVEATYMLGRACGSTGMIFAMHQIMVACLVRHMNGSEWHMRLLRQLSSEQMLLASSTTDGMGGGDLRKSDCAVEQQAYRFTLTKSATVLSYGANADGILTTARRTPDSPPTDQVFVALTKNDYKLHHLVDWDTLGMRGTCSTGFTLESAGGVEQIFPDPYHKIHSQTVMPVANLTWAAVWAGIAASAVERARLFTRKAARKANDKLPPGAAHVTRASATLAMLRATIKSSLKDYESATANETSADALEFQIRTNLLKVNASELAISIVTSALQACGLSGYRNDGEFSVARQMRDILSSSIMINNDRILSNVASTALLVDIAASLTD
ncbi:MAG TPA: acyl-CoA dehydrogenase family protein [Xanthobacteraceae bacterium]|nr:acyl-CoA dehydrogenase family protein [Xanthobacteraceae bacterium]